MAHLVSPPATSTGTSGWQSCKRLPEGSRNVASFTIARNFFGLPFELHSCGFQSFALGSNIVHAQDDRRARLLARLRFCCHSDGRFALGARELRPTLHLKRFLQTQHIAVKLLRASKSFTLNHETVTFIVLLL